MSFEKQRRGMLHAAWLFAPAVAVSLVVLIIAWATDGPPPAVLYHDGRPASAYVNRGISYHAKGDYDRAIAAFSRAIEINPRYAGAYNNRGIAHGRTGDRDRAIDDFTKAIEINPGFADTYHNRGMEHSAKGDYDRAIADYTKAIEINGQLAPIYGDRGLVYQRKSDYDRAIADYTKAIEINGQYAVVYGRRAIAYRLKGDYDRAIADANHLLALRPSDAITLNTRGHIFEALGRREEAIADFRWALDINPNIEETREALKRLGPLQHPIHLGKVEIRGVDDAGGGGGEAPVAQRRCVHRILRVHGFLACCRMAYLERTLASGSGSSKRRGNGSPGRTHLSEQVSHTCMLPRSCFSPLATSLPGRHDGHDGHCISTRCATSRVLMCMRSLTFGVSQICGSPSGILESSNAL
jgi:tetratricopeptide (TPR) repeat protein